MAALPALLVFLLLHGWFFHDVVGGDRSLSAATYTAGLTPRGPLGAPPEPGPPHLLDVEGAAWVDEPSPYLAHDAFEVGELPLWNPGTGFGAPLAANLNSGAGNPLQLLLNLAPTPVVADAFYLTRLLVLAACTWAFLRALALGSAAALIGAVIVAYGGYAMAWIAHHALSTELFLPMMLLGFERGRRGHAGGWVVLALAGTGSLLGGKLQASLLCFAFVAAYALRRASPRQGGAGGRSMVPVGAGIAIACVAAAYLMVPAFELMSRASGLTLGGRSQLAAYTVPWPSLASLAVPRLFTAPGHPFAENALLTPAIGLVALVLAAVGVAATGAPQLGVARFCAFWAVAFLLRNAGGFGDLAVWLPVARNILFVKYTFTVVFALAVAAAVGFDAILAGRVAPERARRAVAIALATVAAFVVGTFGRSDYLRPQFGGLAVPLLLAALLIGTMAVQRFAGRRAVAALLALALIGELRWLAPHQHPPRLDPYRPPAFVDFLVRAAAPGRIIADPDLLVPLTSAAAGLRDLRAIDVLTPGDSYAFFTRVLSFCDRLIHFTVDPDVTLAATAPALDLAGVRYVVTRQTLGADDLAQRVRRQVGRERTARLFAGMTRFRTAGAPLALGPIAVADEKRFAFTFRTPFTLDVTAKSEAPELAWGTLVRGDGRPVQLRVAVDGVPSDAPDVPVRLESGERWQEQRIPLGNAGTLRRVRLTVVGTTDDGRPADVSLGDLGFGPGAAAEARLAVERAARHRDELAQLALVFRDPALGVSVYENRNVMPRAFRVGEVEPTGSADAALTRLGDGFDFRSTALVPKADLAALTAALAPGRSMPATPRADGDTQIRGETPNTVTIATAGSTSALVVLADLAYPGWQAMVDDRDAPIVPVDGLLRGVLVPAGAHRVAFRYRPASLLLGVAITVLGLIALWPYARWAARTSRSTDPS